MPTPFGHADPERKPAPLLDGPSCTTGAGIYPLAAADPDPRSPEDFPISLLEEPDRDAAAVVIDVADIPGGGRLHLVRTGQDHEIMFGEDQLMGSWAHRSEEALATLVAERLATAAPRVLIGGLGLGFTLQAALAALPTAAVIVVAELVPKVVAWATGPLSQFFGTALGDARVSIRVQDVHDVLASGAERWDAILLDVDNGPDALITAGNDRLYCNWGLRAAWTALNPGGVLAVWSSFPDDAFAVRLDAAGFMVEEVVVGSGATDEDPRHVIWLAHRPW